MDIFNTNTEYVHAKKHIVLGAHAQILPDSAEFTANVFAENVGCAGGGREQPCQDRPTRNKQETQKPRQHFNYMRQTLSSAKPKSTVDNACTILHSCGFASSVVSEEGGDLSFVEPQGQSVHGQFVSMTVDLHKILNVNTWIYVARLFLDADG